MVLGVASRNTEHIKDMVEKQNGKGGKRGGGNLTGAKMRQKSKEERRWESSGTSSRYTSNVYKEPSKFMGGGGNDGFSYSNTKQQYSNKPTIMNKSYAKDSYSTSNERSMVNASNY